jgi:hypothetical protein
LTNALGDKVRTAGQAVIEASAEQTATTLASQLRQLISPPYRIESAAIADNLGRTTAHFEVLICNSDQVAGAGGDVAVVPTGPDAPAHQFHEALRNRQAQPRAPEPARSG